MRITITIDPFRDVEGYWMSVDKSMAEKLHGIQLQGEGWSDQPEYIVNAAARDDHLTMLWIGLVGELAMAAQRIRLLGYPQAAQEGDVLRRMIETGDVRKHEIRQAIVAYHHQFHPEQGRYLVK